ncbi:MAG: hypothetical protein ABW136_09160 [Steroidobacteraceae bacterium]
MLEALLLGALSGSAMPLADSRVPTKPSLELLEFLGEFGDDEDGVFDTDEAATPAPVPRTPEKKAKPPAKPEPVEAGKERP